MDRVKLTLRIPEEIYEALEKISADFGIGLNQLIIIALLFRYNCI